MTDPQLEAFYEACVAAPAADAPRIALAAYLDQRGDPWGAFIRTQLAYTKALQEGDDERAGELQREHARILGGNGPRWSNGVDKLVKNVQFSRGLVEYVVVDAQPFLEHAGEIFRLAPIRHLVVSNLDGQLEELLGLPSMAQLASLAIGRSTSNAKLGDAGLASIAACPRLRKLRLLDVSFQDIGPMGLDALAASKQLPALVYVNLAGNRVEDPGERAGSDWTGRADLSGLTMPQLGRDLEAKYGDIAWLHALTRLPSTPPRFAAL